MFVAHGPERSHDRLAEFCAAGREAVRRALGLRLFDEQLLGVLGLMAGHVLDMATGEGKTLCGAIAAAGFAAQGRQVHVLSVNDYLAQRDREWMHPVYALLGVSVDCVQQSHSSRRRRETYAAQVVYSAISEIGFDVLRDRLVTDVADRVGPELDVTIIDEIDSVVIDEARVPLVLAGAIPAEDINPIMMDIVRTLRPDRDYQVDAERRNVALTDHGTTVVEAALGGINLYTAAHTETLAGVNVALHALALLSRDVDYLVRDDAVALINPSRGRVAALQRWPDGIQAAAEAKEGVPPSPTGEVLDSITIGNLVRRYQLVAGMTGTAVAVADELREFHQLEVMVVPRHDPCIRIDAPDRIYTTAQRRRHAAVARIRMSMPPDDRFSSVPKAWQPPTNSPPLCKKWVWIRRYSTHETTLRKPPSSPGRERSGESRSPPRWLAEAPIFGWWTPGGWAAFMCWGMDVTTAAGSTTNSAVGPDGRATRAAASSSPVSTTRSSPGTASSLRPKIHALPRPSIKPNGSRKRTT